MNPEKTYQHIQADAEIDLVEILSSVGLVAYKHLKMLLVLGILGVCSGFIYASLRSPSYSSRLVLESKVVGYADLSPLLQTLNELVKEDNLPELARKLNITPDIARKLKSIKGINIFQEEIGRPEKDFILSFKIAIKVTVASNDILPAIEKGILYYLENNEYVKSRIDTKVKNLETQINNLKKEIQQMDSLKKSIQTLINQPQTTSLYLPDLGSLFEQSNNLHKEKLEMEYDLKFSKNFQILEKFTAFIDPVSFGILGSGAIGGGIAFVCWVLMVVFQELGKLLRKRRVENTLK
ncbi:MAG: hypothetical protein NW226_21145 [Microscillaceae bacterium]|nr:hypothetical protein [Microscillaceae bacterium]